MSGTSLKHKWGNLYKKNMLEAASEGIGKKKTPIPVNTNVLCAAEAVCIFHNLQHCTTQHYASSLLQF